jgi:hypothetical protein
MEDSSEDLPKPTRRMAARPFFSPRPSTGDGGSAPLNLGRRSSAQLFTPPGSTPVTVRDKSSRNDAATTAVPASAPVSDAADEATATEFEGDWTPVPLIHSERALEVDSSAGKPTNPGHDELVVEQYEPKVIELTAAAPDVEGEHSIEVIAYDDANSLLKATTIDGKDPEVDGLRLESTEFSFEREIPPSRGSAYGSWTAESFTRLEERKTEEATHADETEATIDEETAGEPVNSSEREPSPMPSEIAPPWMGRSSPLSSQSLEELKESEPWDLTPSHGLDSIPDDLEASGLWPTSATVIPAPENLSAIDASARHEIADALVRIAARVRDGELEVQQVADMTEESVLSAVLTAFLRLPR